VEAVVTSQDMINLLGEAVSLIGNADFGSRFYKLVDETIGIDHCTVFVFRDDSPHMLVAEAQSLLVSQKVSSLAQRYVASGFHSDPIWKTGHHSGIYGCSVFLLSPTQLPDERYREEFYVGPNIQNELALTATFGNERVYAAFYRENGRDGFNQDAVNHLKFCGRPLLQALQKHAQMLLALQLGEAQRPLRREELMERVRTAILADNKQITPREAEICACIVLGYTVLGISLNLGISINTVATHRKRAYAKLRISSQNELFARYFSAVERHLTGAMLYN